MKAVEFIKKFGWEEAKRLQSTQGKTITELKGEFIEKQLNIFRGYIVKDSLMSMVDLKRLVESWELLESFFNLDALGFDKCIEIAKKQIKEFEGDGIVQFWHRWDDELSCTVERMKQAITDVESVELS